MLLSLNIQNVVLIDRLTVDFKEGLCALTGETGAGKSILLDSLGLAIGARAESRLVRKGSTQAQVIAEFAITKNHPVTDHLSEANLENIDLETEGLILRRVLNVDGKSRAFINDQPVSIGVLKKVGECLIEIHGQFDTHGLLDPTTHVRLLDEYANITTTLSTLWKVWKEAQSHLEHLKETAQDLREEEAFLRQSLEDLDALNPRTGEEDELKALRQSFMHREQILEGLNAAYHALNTDEDPVRKAWGIIDRIADKMGESASEAIGALNRAVNEVQEAIEQIQILSNNLEEGEESLEVIDDRLHALRTQARKHKCLPDALVAKREEMAEQLNLIEHGDDVLSAQIKKVETAKQNYVQKAEEVSTKRKKTAKKLADFVQKELPPLKLDKATFVCAVTPLDEEEWGVNGIDRVRFLIATNPGSDPGPLGKVASGGEMARLMLALKVVMTKTGSAQTLMFDEVDAGVGGAVADAVGERLAKLAIGKQIYKSQQGLRIIGL